MTKENIKLKLLANKQILKKYKVKSIAIFGSYARNEQKKNSDVDLLVDFHKDVTLFDLIDLQNYVSGILRKKVNIVSRNGLSKYIGPYIIKEAEPIAKRL